MQPLSGRVLWLGMLLTLGGALLRLIALADTSFWNDEFFTVFFAQQSLERSFELMLIDAVHAPAYFVMVRPFVHDGDFIARLLAVAFGVVAIPIAIGTTRRLFHDHTLALWVGALVMVNPLHIWMSRMTRPYSLLFLVALLTSYYFLRLLQGHRSIRNWLLFLVLSTLLYLTHYFGAMVAIAQFLVLVIVLRNDAMFLRVWLLVQIIAGAPLLGWIVALSQQESLSFGIAWIPVPTLLDPLLTLGSLLTGYYGADNAYVLLPAMMLVLFGIALGLVQLAQHPLQNKAVLYGGFLTIVPLVLVFVIALNFINAFVDRYFIVILPGMLWLVVYAWWQALPTQAFSGIMLLIVLSGGLYASVTLQTGADEREDWHDAVQYVAAHYQPGDTLLINPAHGILPLRRYWPGTDVDSLTVHVDDDTADTLLDADGRVWVLFKNPNVDIHREILQADFDPLNSEAALSEWLQPRRAYIQTITAYNGVTVLLLQNNNTAVALAYPINGTTKPQMEIIGSQDE